MLARGQITVTNIDDGKTPFLHQAYKMKDGRFLKHYPVYEAPPVNGYKAGDLWHKTDGSQPGYFVANKSNTTLNLNDWTFYANELAYSDTDKFYPKFEGTYSDYNEVASDDQTKYTWKIIKADDGVGIKSVKEYYAVSASNITPPSSASDWSETPKTTNTTNKYLWNYEVYTYSNGDVKETTKRVIGTHGTTGATGASGQSVTSITEEYYLSTSKTSQTGGSWKTTPDPWEIGKYQWTRSKIVYINPTKTGYTDPVIDTSWEAIDGIQVGGRNLLLNSNFKTGNLGEWSNNGSVTFVNIDGRNTAYVNTSSGIYQSQILKDSGIYTFSFMAKALDSTTSARVGFLNAGTGASKSFSLTSTWQRYEFTTTVSIATSQIFHIYSHGKRYYITDIQVEKGNKATDWSPALEDTQQAIDSKVTETDVEYYLSTSSTTPTGGTWATTAPPWVDGKFMWSRTKIVYGTGTPRYAPSATGTCIAGATGNTGNGIVSVTNRYLATTLDKGVTTATSGWTTAVQATDSVKKYLWNYEEILYTNGKKIPTAPVIIGTHGDKGDKGSTGVGIKNIQEFYLASPLGEGVTRSTDGWTSDVQAIDSDKKYLWNYEKINYDNNTNYLTAPVIIGTFGSQGIGFKGVTEYYLASPLSEGIRKDTNGWTTEMQPLTPENKYLWNKEIIHYTDDESALKDKTEVLSGTEIFTDKADADAVVHVDIDGKSYQHAGSGKNLFKDFPEIKNGFKYEHLNRPGEGGLRIDGSSISQKLVSSETYTISLNIRGLGNIVLYRISSLGNSALTLANSSDLSESEYRKISLTFAPHKAELDTIWIYTSYKATAYTSWFEIEPNSLMLEKSGTTSTYEPPAPSPDYPIEIHSLNDFDVVSSVGKRNIFQLSKFEDIPSSSSSVVSLIKDGFRLTNTYGYGIGFANPDLKPGKTYTISGEVIAKSGSGNGIEGRFVILTKDATKAQSIMLYSGGKGKFTSTFSTPTDFNYNNYHALYAYGISTKADGIPGVVDFINIKIEEGKDQTPHSLSPEEISEKSENQFIDKINLLLSEPLRSVGDTKDRLYRDTDGLWKVERNVGEITLDGSRSYSTRVNSNPEYSSYYITNSDIAVGAKMASSHYPFFEHSGSYISREGQQIRNYMDTSASIMITDYTMTHAQFKNKLRNSPATVIYEKRNTEIETLSQADQDKLNNMASYKDSNYLYTIVDKTNILPNYVSENLKPNLHATFKSKAWSGNNAGYPSVIGVYGDSAKMLYLSATAESMTFNADGTPNPSSQVITLTANLQNVSGNASFAATAYNGSTVVSDVVLSGVGNTRTFNQAQFPASANRVQVRATLGNLVDTVTIVKLANGSNGQNAVVGLLTNESITLPANKDGLVSNFTGASGVFDVYDGITKKTGTGVKYSVVDNSQSNITVNINATTGAYSVRAMPTGTTVLNGHAVLRAVYNGVTVEKQLSVSKSLTGATGATGPQGATGATGSRGPTGATGTSVSSVTEYYLATSESSGISSEDTRFTTAIQTMTAAKKYLWNYEKINFSNNTSQPTIPVIIGVYGDKGQTGSTGATGRSITSITEHYLATSASSGVTRSTPGWRTTMQPTTEANKYLWNYETVNWSSGTTPTYVEPIIIGVHGAKGPQGATGPKGDSGKDGIAGKDGKGISSTTITYGLSTTDTVEPTNYNSDVPTLVKGQYLWTKTVWKYTDNTTETGYTKTYIAKDGNTGNDGLPGKAGVGISSTKIEYAGSTSGTTKPTSGWNPAVPTVAQGSFLWTRTIWTYTDNTTETGYSVARMGSNGATGASATSYWITASNNIIGKSQTGVINPTTITFKGFSKTGTANSVAYSGRFIIQTSTNGTDYATRYATPSNTNESSCTYKIPANSLFVKCLFYMAGGTTVLLDEQTVPIVESAEGIEVGGRNLLANSGRTITNGTYNIATYNFTIPPSQGDLMTVTIKGELASTKSHFAIYNSGGSVSLGSLKSVGGGLYTLTFKWNIGTSSNTSLYVYAFTNAQAGVSTIEWIKLEKGTVATDWTPAPEDMATATEFSSLEQTVKGIKTTVGNKAEQTQVTQLAGQWSATVAKVDGHTGQINNLGKQINLRVTKDSFDNLLGVYNLLPNSSARSRNANGWNSNVRVVGSGDNFEDGYAFKYVGAKHVGSPYMPDLKAGKYTIVINYKANSVTRLQWRLVDKRGTKSVNIINKTSVPAIVTREVITITLASDFESPYLDLSVDGSDYIFTDLMVVKGEHAPEKWIESSVDNSITQINLSTDGVLISGKKVMIDGDTYIENGVIKSAHIDNLSASKITAGTLNAALVSISASSGSKQVLLNADGMSTKDSTGKLRLSIGVRDIGGVGQSDPANIVFYSGNGKNSMYIGTNVENTFVIAPAGGNMRSLFSMPAGLIISSNQLRLTDPRGTNDYLEIRRTLDGTNEMIVFPSRPFSGQLGSAAENRWFRIMRSSQIIGHTLNVGYGAGSPHLGDLSVGVDSGDPAAGSTQAFVRSRAIYNRIYGSQPTACVTEYGTLGRIVSARKYKEQITPCVSAIDNARKVLEISPSEWYIKGKLDKREYGFIADDFHELGLTEVVQYGTDGQVEGLAYDRISMYLLEILKDHERQLDNMRTNTNGELWQLKCQIEELKKEVKDLKQVSDEKGGGYTE